MKTVHKKRWQILFGLLLLITQANAQNLIFNGGFENGDVAGADQNYNEATDVVDFTADYLYSWQRAHRSDGKTHSPDWRYMIPSGTNFGKNSNKDQVMVQPGVNVVTVFPAASGFGMIGLGKHELIQQAVDIDKMHAMADENTTMVLRFKVRVPSVGTMMSNTKLGVYFSKDKLKYKGHEDEDVCKESFAELDHYNDYEEIVAYDQLASRFPPGDWHQVEYIFSAPQRIDQYEWIGFNVRSFEASSGCGVVNNYLYVDDVELFIGCPDLCSRTDGYFNHNGIVTTSSIGPSSVFTMEGLNDVNSVDFKVWALNGTPVYENSTSCVNGISHPLYWDGTTAGGSAVAAANYKYEITLTKTGCGTMKLPGYLSKLNGNYTGTNHTNFDAICENGPNLTPEPCCALEPDIKKDYEVLYGPGKLEYIAVNHVLACTKAPDFSDEVVVADGANVLFRAGKHIMLAEGFHTVSGSVFVAEIVPCHKSAKVPQGGGESGNRMGMSIPSGADQAIGETGADEKKQQVGPGEASGITLYPNPSANGICRIGLNGINISPEAIPVYRVYNANGEVVRSGQLNKYQTEIDMRNYPKGIYLVYVTVNGETWTSRLILQ